MKWIAVCLLVLPALIMAAELHESEYEFLFGQFMTQYGRNGYSAQEKDFRYATFKSNVDWMIQHNREGHTYTVGVNEFADWTHEEYVQFIRSSGKFRPIEASHTHVAKPGVKLPPSIDWRQKGAVTPVKNQGGCGSCWAFSAVCAMEGSWAISKKTLVPLSEQQLVDCDKGRGDEGCRGGMMHTAFEYVIANKGIDTEACYPYAGYDQSCKFKASCIGATFTSYTNVTINNDLAMQTAVAQQPVAIAIYAEIMSFEYYSGGIYSDKNCKTKFEDLDHGVAIVGYGTESGKDFYIVKNSWGRGWGESGYIRMQHSPTLNICGLLDYGLYPNV